MQLGDGRNQILPGGPARPPHARAGVSAPRAAWAGRCMHVLIIWAALPCWGRYRARTYPRELRPNRHTRASNPGGKNGHGSGIGGAGGDASSGLPGAPKVGCDLKSWPPGKNQTWVRVGTGRQTGVQGRLPTHRRRRPVPDRQHRATKCSLRPRRLKSSLGAGPGRLPRTITGPLYPAIVLRCTGHRLAEVATRPLRASATT